MNKEDLYEHLREQRGFLEVSCREYDNGNKGEAKRTALEIRKLLHDTSRSESLLKKLGDSEGFLVHDTSKPRIPGDLAPYLGLVIFGFMHGCGGYIPPLGNGPPYLYQRGKIPFLEWWEMPVADNKRELYT
jgi:hypothetical protein